MGEDVARALGAGGIVTIEIAGRQCSVRPLGIRELAEATRECVAWYRRQYLRTYHENLDLFPEGQRAALMEAKTDAAARWDEKDLPEKWAHDQDKIVLTEALRNWLAQTLGQVLSDEAAARRATAAVLDQGMLDAKAYRKMSGCEAPRVRVGYSNWWVTGNYDGMITLAWICFKRDGVTRDQVADALASMPVLMEVTSEIERLSGPKPGNG